MVNEFGIPEWRPNNDPVSTLVQIILSQNTSDTNSRYTFLSLRTSFTNWEKVSEADVNTVARCIKSGGLSRIKALRIKKALGEIIHQRGQLELDFLKHILCLEFVSYPPHQKVWVVNQRRDIHAVYRAVFAEVPFSAVLDDVLCFLRLQTIP